MSYSVNIQVTRFGLIHIRYVSNVCIESVIRQFTTESDTDTGDENASLNPKEKLRQSPPVMV